MGQGRLPGKSLDIPSMAGPSLKGSPNALKLKLCCTDKQYLKEIKQKKKAE